MGSVLAALGNALKSVLHPKMLTLTIWPMLVALSLWIGLAWFHWETWSHWLSALITGSVIADWLPRRGFVDLVHYTSMVLVFALLAPMILITAVLIAAVIEMPLIVNFVAARDYPQLERRHGGTVIASIANAATAVLVFAGLWIITLPLWLTGVLALILPLILSAWLNQRLFRFDALSDHATRAEYCAIVEASWGRMYLLGLLLALFYYIPLANLLVPVLSGLAFTHFGLAELAKLRNASGKAVPSIVP